MSDTVHTVNSILRRLLALCLQLLLQRSGHGRAEGGCGSPSYFFCTTIPRVFARKSCKLPNPKVH
ncbi:hypothetical protein KIAC18_001795 [Sporomusa sphaeroides]|uniref:hypothetical protein n=1 Tax=Sporomusa sphaeroides TaxID=47679 RepID=UPI003DA0B22A